VFLIFGVSRKVARLATVLARCRFCQTPAAQVIVRVRTYFSFFFIPVIPLGTKYRATCALCGSTSEITAEEAGQLVQAAAVHQAAGPAAPGLPGAPAAPGWAPPPAVPGAQAAHPAPAVPPPPLTPPPGPPTGV
jgi:hypothetical protein